MANIQSSQAFYALTLEPSSAPTAAVTCNVIPGLKSQDQQIFEARGTRILLKRVVESEDRMAITVKTILEQDTFSIVRGVSAFRIPGTTTDQLVVSSDSGRIVMLNYDAEKNTFKRIHQETFGKSGIRRTVPGQYLANDVRGRCYMLASAEKNKVVYIVNRNSEGGVIISSPHEANQWSTLCFAVCGLDTGWNHPVFATLEVDYSDAENDPSEYAYHHREKQLVYYTVDLGLNHVVKSWSDTVDYTANMIFGVPGATDGPSGVLVCSQDRISYHHDTQRSISISIPRRQGPTEDPNRKRYIVAGCLHLNRSRHEYFFLLQTEDGDVFKLTISMASLTPNSPQYPDHINLRYFETFPVAKQMLILRKGYIYVVPENGNSILYNLNDLAVDPAVEPWNTFSSSGRRPSDFDAPPLYFKPRGLRYTSIVADIPCLNPLMRTHVDNPLEEDAPQIYAIQGTGNRSVFKTIRHGIEPEDIASNPLGDITFDSVWSLKHRSSDEHHSYLLLTSVYADRTLALSVGDLIETMENSKFLLNRATIVAAQMGDSTLVQVHARGVHSILETGEVNQWHTPTHRTVVVGSANQHQLLLGLSSAELCFFFMGEDGVLQQLEDMPVMSGKVTALSVGKTPVGQQQARYAVVGCDDCTIRVLSIELDTPLEARSIQAVSDVPTSIEVVEQLDPASNTMVSYAHIGLKSGLYLRAVIDEVTGELSDVRTKFLGSKEVRVFPVEINEQDCIVACSSRTWLGYIHPQSQLYTMVPLITKPLVSGAPIANEQFRGLCGLQGQDMLITTIPSLEGGLQTSSVPLNYTPRAMTRNPWYPVWYVAQSEGNALSVATKQQLLANPPEILPFYDTTTQTVYPIQPAQPANPTQPDVKDEEVTIKKETKDSSDYHPSDSLQDVPMKEDPEPTPWDLEPAEMERHLGLPRGTDHWASCISAVDPIYNKVITSNLELEENEAALCVATVQFESKNWECFLAVGTSFKRTVMERTVVEGVEVVVPGSERVESGGYVHIYRLLDEGRTLEFLHKTEYEMPIYALLPFRGRLAMGIGNELFIYDIGMKALLRKSRGAMTPNQIVTLEAMGNRIVCGDISDSVTYVVFKPEFNRMISFVDDTIQRWTTASAMVDYETTAGGDKFGNLWIMRCPEVASKEADEEGIGGYIVNERSYLGGAPYRLENRAHYFVNDIPMSMQRTALVAGGQEVLFWSGLQGTMGILIPFISREDLNFFSQLESMIRTEEKPITGRDHLMYRGYYVPVKGVIDGDLCERFMQLSYDSKQKIAAEVEKEIKEIEKKVQEMRTRVAF